MQQVLVASRDFLDRRGQLTSPSKAAQALRQRNRSLSVASTRQLVPRSCRKKAESLVSAPAADHRLQRALHHGHLTDPDKEPTAAIGRVFASFRGRGIA